MANGLSYEKARLDSRWFEAAGGEPLKIQRVKKDQHMKAYTKDKGPEKMRGSHPARMSPRPRRRRRCPRTTSTPRSRCSRCRLGNGGSNDLNEALGATAPGAFRFTLNRLFVGTYRKRQQIRAFLAIPPKHPAPFYREIQAQPTNNMTHRRLNMAHAKTYATPTTAH